MLCVLQCVAVCCSVLQIKSNLLGGTPIILCVLQRVALCCSVLQINLYLSRGTPSSFPGGGARIFFSELIEFAPSDLSFDFFPCDFLAPKPLDKCALDVDMKLAAAHGSCADFARVGSSAPFFPRSPRGDVSGVTSGVTFWCVYVCQVRGGGGCGF